MFEYLGVGPDISKVRGRLLDNLHLAERDGFDKDVHQFLTKIIEHLEKQEDYRPIMDTVIRWVCDIMKRRLGNLLRSIYRRPFRINCLSVLAIEYLYFFDNDADNRHINELHPIFQRRHIINLSKWVALLDENNPGVMRSFLRTLAEEDQDDPEFSLFFAYTLRQTSLYRIADFLRLKKRYYRGDFELFLELVLDDYSHLFPKKTIKTCRKWLKEERKNEARLELTASVLDDNATFLPPPDDYVIIPGRLRQEQLEHFFSFLSTETNGVPDGEPLLRESEVNQLLKYGFSYPASGTAKRRFCLRDSTQIPLSIFYYMFYSLLQKHRPLDATADYKTHFAQFLRAHFVNFQDRDLDSLRNSLRNRRPKKMVRSFRVEDYFKPVTALGEGG